MNTHLHMDYIIFYADTNHSPGKKEMREIINKKGGKNETKFTKILIICQIVIMDLD